MSGISLESVTSPELGLTTVHIQAVTAFWGRHACGLERATCRHDHLFCYSNNIYYFLSKHIKQVTKTKLMSQKRSKTYLAGVQM
jgi:hypothetical protein